MSDVVVVEVLRHVTQVLDKFGSKVDDNVFPQVGSEELRFKAEFVTEKLVLRG